MSQLTFQYTAVDREGTRTKGTLNASDQRDAYRQLSAAGLRPVRLGTRGSRRRRRRVTPKDLAHFTYQLSVLLEARIHIVDGLRSIGEQEPNEALRAIIEDVATSIASGGSVTASLEAHRSTFGSVYVETVHAAEVSGNMVEVLSKLAEMLDSNYELSKAVKGAMMYPACVVGALSLALGFLLMFVVPRFSNMFASRGVDLPLPTLVLLELSNFLTSYWYLVIGVAVGGVWGVRQAWRDPRWRTRIDGWLHRVPFLKSILMGVAVSRFAHVFGLTLRSGLSLIDALEVSGRASGRPLLQADAQKMQEQVKHGGRLSDVMMRCGYLPGFAKRLFIAGEEAAELTRMCEIVGRHYDREVGYLTKNISTAIEPIMVIGLAAVVLVVALAIFLPMWNMASLMG